MKIFKNPIVVISLTSILIFAVLLFYKYNLSYQLKINGAKTNAIITQVNYENYTVNEYDPYTINHYFITYEYYVNHQKYQQVYEILDKDYSNYSRDTLNIKDSIAIIYLVSNPRISKLLPINK